MNFNTHRLIGACAIALTLVTQGGLAQAALDQAQAGISFDFIFSSSGVFDHANGMTGVEASIYGLGPTPPYRQTNHSATIEAENVALSVNGIDASASTTVKATGGTLAAAMSANFNPTHPGELQSNGGSSLFEGVVFLAPGESVDIVSNYTISGTRSSDLTFCEAFVNGAFYSMGLPTAGPNQTFRAVQRASLTTSPDPSFSKTGSFTASFVNNTGFVNEIEYLFSANVDGGIGDPAAPVPEPGTWLMLAAGLGAIFARSRYAPRGPG